MTSAKRIINELAQIYSIVDPALVIDYAPGVIFRTPAHIDAALDTDYQFLVEAANPAAPKDGVTLAFAGVGLVAICHVDLIVNGEVCARICTRLRVRARRVRMRILCRKSALNPCFSFAYMRIML